MATKVLDRVSVVAPMSMFSIRYRLQHVPDHQEMRQVVDLHSLLMVVSTPFGVIQTWLVYTGVTNQSIDRLSESKFLHIFAKLSDTVKGS